MNNYSKKNILCDFLMGSLMLDRWCCMEFRYSNYIFTYPLFSVKVCEGLKTLTPPPPQDCRRLPGLGVGQQFAGIVGEA